MARVYEIHHNHARPYRVAVHGNTVTAYGNNISHDWECRRVMLGASEETVEWADWTGPECLGNTILLEIADRRYILISDRIYQFSTEDWINYFASPIGNNDVPYPYAIGDIYSYILTDMKRAITADLPEASTPYKEYIREHNLRCDGQPVVSLFSDMPHTVL